MKCEVCGTEIPEGFKFCSECGAPVPQNKVCPSCKTEVPAKMKFCFNCGYNFEQQSTSAVAGIAMGDKNVVAGDLIGSKDDIKISGNATIVKNTDETKKVVTCHICGKNLTIIDTHTCPLCGQVICEKCYDFNNRRCFDCSSKMAAEEKSQKIAKSTNDNDLVGIKLTSDPVLLQKGTDGSVGTSGIYVLFGDWPQSLKAENIKIEDNKSYNINGWVCFKGDDNCFYVKEKVKNGFTSSSGKSVKKGKDSYFKLESIKWRVLDNNYEGGKLLFSENALSADCYCTRFEEMKFNNKVVYPSNYEYSKIRAFLNGLDGSEYDEDDFTNQGFINKAFSQDGLNRIQNITVDCSKQTLLGRGDSFVAGMDNPEIYVCNNTNDKIFLLSEEEITREKFNFDVFDVNDKRRIRQMTDFAQAEGANNYFDDASNRNVDYWLRSPHFGSGNDSFARFGYASGHANTEGMDDFSVDAKNIGIVPALVLKN